MIDIYGISKRDVLPYQLFRIRSFLRTNGFESFQAILYLFRNVGGIDGFFLAKTTLVNLQEDHGLKQRYQGSFQNHPFFLSIHEKQAELVDFIQSLRLGWIEFGEQFPNLVLPVIVIFAVFVEKYFGRFGIFSENQGESGFNVRI
jgi:hypothetical protein